MKREKLFLIVILFIAFFLRLWKIGEVPVSLFGDELDVGYHAYSILKTGKDYSGNFMPLHFQSLAECKDNFPHALLFLRLTLNLFQPEVRYL